MQFVTFTKCEDFAESLRRELENVFDRKIKLSPIIGIDTPIAYTEGVKLINNAKYRLIVSQRTSCLFLGPRNGATHEHTFYSELLNWINTPRETSGYFLHYFSWKATLDAAKMENYSLQEAKENLERVFANNYSNNKFILKASDDFETIPHVIGDTGLGFNFYIGNNRYYLFLPCFLTKDKELQQIIANVQSIGTQQSWDDIKKCTIN